MRDIFSSHSEFSKKGSIVFMALKYKQVLIGKMKMAVVLSLMRRAHLESFFGSFVFTPLYCSPIFSYITTFKTLPNRAFGVFVSSDHSEWESMLRFRNLLSKSL